MSMADVDKMLAYQDEQAATLYRLKQQQAASIGAIGARSPAGKGRRRARVGAGAAVERQ